jgi:hypothetical protein
MTEARMFAASIALLLAAVTAPSIAADPAPLPEPAPRYAVRVEKSVMMPMGDGVRLSTDGVLHHASGRGAGCGRRGFPRADRRQAWRRFSIGARDTSQAVCR